jgi:serine O-acetyltransferase
MFASVARDLDAVLERDPAARSRLEVALCYPGFHALLLHRVAHALWRRGWRFSARFLSMFGRWMTGIEIHPGATVGGGFFIDHGMGVVIGETAEIGDNVTLYQGVTLGGISPSVNSAAQVNVKRHPTLENGVIVGAGAAVLGAIRVGAGARVGSNAVVTRDVASGATVVGIPARIAGRVESPPATATARDFAAYGLPGGEVPDPVSRVCDQLIQQVDSLTNRVAELEGRLENKPRTMATGGAGGARPGNEA